MKQTNGHGTNAVTHPGDSEPHACSCRSLSRHRSEDEQQAHMESDRHSPTSGDTSSQDVLSFHTIAVTLAHVLVQSP